MFYCALALLLAFSSGSGTTVLAQGPPCGASRPEPLCAFTVRPYSENACVWKNVCEFTAASDALIASNVERYDEGFPCTGGYIATCCASFTGCANGLDCDVETSQPYPPSDPSAVNLPTGWTTAVQCAVDDASRILTDVTVEYLTSGNSPSNCATHCASLGYHYAGVEYSDECYCGTGLVTPIVTAPNDECNMCCTTSFNSDTCGGSWRMQIYTNSV